MGLLSPSAALPCLGTKGLTILTWNVLLPNSKDGWWLYKYYGPGVPAEATTWEARQALMKERLLSADADVICLQETSSLSFATDFSFLLDAGYDCAIMSKGRMRPATFWKRNRLELCCADGSKPNPKPPAPPQSAGEPLPTFIESTFTSKVAYEAWVKQEKKRAAAAEKEAKTPAESKGDETEETAEERALAAVTATAAAAAEGGAVVLHGDRLLTTV